MSSDLVDSPAHTPAGTAAPQPSSIADPVALDPTIFSVDPSRLMQTARLLESPSETTDTTVNGADSGAAKCPVPGVMARAMGADACPFPVGGANRAPVQRSKADNVMRTILRIKERPEGVSEKAAIKAFERSMLISATRCTLTYVVFPIVLPMLSMAKGVGVMLGIVIGVIALTCDVFTVRRFFAIDHKWRWRFTFIAGAVMGLLTWLLVEDISHLIS